jgi:hypothetical protein
MNATPVAVAEMKGKSERVQSNSKGLGNSKKKEFEE